MTRRSDAPKFNAGNGRPMVPLDVLTGTPTAAAPDASALQPRLALARELIGDHLRTVDTHCEFNVEIEILLGANWPEAADNGNDAPLPGENLAEIRKDLLKAIELAEQPVPGVKKGRWSLIPQPGAQGRRDRLSLLARVALALIEPLPAAC